jgi:hypothetical protein
MFAAKGKVPEGFYFALQKKKKAGEFPPQPVFLNRR